MGSSYLYFYMPVEMWFDWKLQVGYLLTIAYTPSRILADGQELFVELKTEWTGTLKFLRFVLCLYKQMKLKFGVHCV